MNDGHTIVQVKNAYMCCWDTKLCKADTCGECGCSIHGGAGAIMSVGLMERLPLKFMENCMATMTGTGESSLPLHLPLWPVSAPAPALAMLLPNRLLLGPAPPPPAPPYPALLLLKILHPNPLGTGATPLSWPMARQRPLPPPGPVKPPPPPPPPPPQSSWPCGSVWEHFKWLDFLKSLAAHDAVSKPLKEVCCAVLKSLTFTAC